MVQINHERAATIYKELFNAPKTNLKNLTQQERKVCLLIAQHMDSKSTDPVTINDETLLTSITTKIRQPFTVHYGPFHIFTRIFKSIANFFGRISSDKLYNTLHHIQNRGKSSQEEIEMKAFLSSFPFRQEALEQIQNFDIHQTAYALRDLAEDTILKKNKIETYSEIQFAHAITMHLGVYLQTVKKTPNSEQEPYIRFIETTVKKLTKHILDFAEAKHKKDYDTSHREFLKKASFDDVGCSFGSDSNAISFNGYRCYIPLINLLIKKSDRPYSFEANTYHVISTKLPKSNNVSFNKPSVFKTVEDFMAILFDAKALMSLQNTYEEFKREFNKYLFGEQRVIRTAEKEYYQNESHLASDWEEMQLKPSPDNWKNLIFDEKIFNFFAKYINMHKIPNTENIYAISYFNNTSFIKLSSKEETTGTVRQVEVGFYTIEILLQQAARQEPVHLVLAKQ